jgi:hypothetical protein
MVCGEGLGMIGSQDVKQPAVQAAGTILVEPMDGCVKAEILSSETRQITSDMRFLFQNTDRESCLTQQRAGSQSPYTFPNDQHIIIWFYFGFLHKGNMSFGILNSQLNVPFIFEYFLKWLRVSMNR